MVFHIAGGNEYVHPIFYVYFGTKFGVSRAVQVVDRTEARPVGENVSAVEFTESLGHRPQRLTLFRMTHRILVVKPGRRRVHQALTYAK